MVPTHLHRPLWIHDRATTTNVRCRCCGSTTAHRVEVRAHLDVLIASTGERVVRSNDDAEPVKCLPGGWTHGELDLARAMTHEQRRTAFTYEHTENDWRSVLDHGPTRRWFERLIAETPQVATWSFEPEGVLVDADTGEVWTKADLGPEQWAEWTAAAEQVDKLPPNIGAHESNDE